MTGFYIFGTANFQDMLPVLFEALKQNRKCWVCFFDCFYKKRQLYHYTKEEIINFFINKCKELNCMIPNIDFYKKEDNDLYLKDYDNNNPSTIFIQEIKPKYPTWFPFIESTVKVIHFAWWDEVKHLTNPKVTPTVSILKQKEDIKYGYHSYPNAYLGNVRLDHLKYATKTKGKKKKCFIPETYLRMDKKNISSSRAIAKFCDKLVQFLHDNDFEIIWKKREKGYPVENWCSPLSLMKNKPDVIIEKDLRFPSSLCEHAYVSDCCIVINDSFAFFDIMHMNTNCIILTTNGVRKHKIDNYFAKDYSENIIDMEREDGWELLKNKIEKSNDFVYNDKINTSKKILNYTDSL